MSRQSSISLGVIGGVILVVGVVIFVLSNKSTCAKLAMSLHASTQPTKAVLANTFQPTKAGAGLAQLATIENDATALAATSAKFVPTGRAVSATPSSQLHYSGKTSVQFASLAKGLHTFGKLADPEAEAESARASDVLAKLPPGINISDDAMQAKNRLAALAAVRIASATPGSLTMADVLADHNTGGVTLAQLRAVSQSSRITPQIYARNPLTKSTPGSQGNTGAATMKPMGDPTAYNQLITPAMEAYILETNCDQTCPLYTEAA